MAAESQLLLVRLHHLPTTLVPHRRSSEHQRLPVRPLTRRPSAPRPLPPRQGQVVMEAWRLPLPPGGLAAPLQLRPPPLLLPPMCSHPHQHPLLASTLPP